MRNPFAYLKDFWIRTKPDAPDTDAVPNRVAFRQMGLRGRTGAKLVTTRVGPTPDMDAHDEHQWVGVRKNKFLRPRLGRSLPWYSHQNAYILTRIRRQAGAINNHRWLMDKPAQSQKET